MCIAHIAYFCVAVKAHTRIFDIFDMFSSCCKQITLTDMTVLVQEDESIVNGNVLKHIIQPVESRLVYCENTVMGLTSASPSAVSPSSDVRSVS